MIDLRSGVVVKTNIIKRRSKSKRKNFVALTILIRMVLNILFHEVLFIPLLNMERFLMMTMTKIPIIIMMMTHVSSYQETVNCRAIKLILKMTFQQNRYRKLLDFQGNKSVTRCLPEKIDSFTDTTKLIESIASSPTSLT